MNSHVTLNIGVKKTAVLRYTEWSMSEEGVGRAGSMENTLTVLKTGCISKQFVHFLNSLLITSCKMCILECMDLFTSTRQGSLFVCFISFSGKKKGFLCILASWLTQRAEGAHAVTALLPCKVFLIAHGAHSIGSWVAIETTACGTKHGHRALVCLLGHCLN